MLSKKAINYFFGKVAMIYCSLLFISWLGLGEFYAQQFRQAGNKLASSASMIDLNIELKKNTKADQSNFDTEIIIMNQSNLETAIRKARLSRQVNNIQLPSLTMAFNTSRQGYIPTILLLSLIFATPIRFRWRKVAALFWGLCLMYLYIVFRMIIWISYKSNGIDFLNFNIAESPLAQKVLNFLYLSFSGDMPLRVIIPVVIWMVVSFRKEDFRGAVAGNGVRRK